MASPHDSRILQAVDLLKAEASDLEHEFNMRFPVFVQEGRVTALLGLSHRIHLLRHLAAQIESI